MDERVSALLVHSEEEPLTTLAAALASQAVEAHRATSCREAEGHLQGSDPPHLVFTDIALGDETWADVLSLASKAQQPVSVIVVSRIVDIKVYIDTIECGAFDYIVPPFASADLAHVVRSATWSASNRRTALAAAA